MRFFNFLSIAPRLDFQLIRNSINEFHFCVTHHNDRFDIIT